MSRQTLVVLILGFAASGLAAQRTPISQPVDSGTVVRLGWVEGTRQIGRLMAPLRPHSEACSTVASPDRRVPKARPPARRPGPRAIC
jgi:hypothetical protein